MAQVHTITRFNASCVCVSILDFVYWYVYIHTYLCLSALGADPAYVTSVSGPHQVLTGRPVTLTCNIAAIPNATVTWYKDGSPVPSWPSISTPDTNAQLTIASATPADSGMYQCVVSNQHGDDVGSISLQVRDPRKGP